MTRAHLIYWSEVQETIIEQFVDTAYSVIGHSKHDRRPIKNFGLSADVYDADSFQCTGCTRP